MSRWFRFLSLVVGGLGAWAGGELSRPALAQDGAMTELYGYGVHRYYAGDYFEAQRVLNMVIEAGIEDPRPHFFRGLTQYRLGMIDSAQVDFERAADLEARGRRAVNVSFALQRIQGPVRQTIEMARLMARVAVYREMMTQPQPSGGVPRPQLDVPVAPVDPGAGIGLPPSLAPEAGPAPAIVPPTETAPPADAVPLPDAEVNPFSDDPPQAPPATEPAMPLPGTEPANPFESSDAPAVPATPATPAEPATPADPFSTPDASAAPATEPAVPATEPATPEATPEPATDADPFGT